MGQKERPMQKSDGMTHLIVNSAKELMKAHPGLSAKKAVGITRKLLEEVNAHIMRQCTPAEWRVLNKEDKATVCTGITMALLDRKKTDAFLNGETKRLVI